MIFETILFAVPLAFWPLYCLVRSEDTRGRRALRKYARIYLALQVLANAYVWYAFLGGYRDWLMTLMFPYFLLYLGCPVGLAIFAINFYARPKEI